MPVDGELDIFAKLAIALGIGLIVGIERGWRARDQPDGSRVAGIRTYTLIGLLGGVAGVLEGDILVIGAGLGVLALTTAGYVTAQMQNLGRGITSEVAALITYLLGVVAVRGDMTVAAASAVCLVFVLAVRELSHDLLKTIEKAELKAAIQLLVISVVILPVLPNKGYGPGGVLNPFELWWTVVVISGISFVAMAAKRLLGERAGLFWAGLLGGFASSTAVAVSYARLGKATPNLAPTLAAGVGAATAVKFLRSLTVAAIIFPAGALVLAPSLVGGALFTGLAVWVMSKRQKKTRSTATAETAAGSDLMVAVSFAAVLAIVTLAEYYAREWFGQVGVLAVAALSGLVDVDAVTISTARQALAAPDRGTSVLALAVPLAVAVNSLAKLTYVVVIAGRDMARSYGIIVAAGMAGMAMGVIASRMMAATPGT
jgi:uncharacterized membrane protein (DUF4010 family)